MAGQDNHRHNGKCGRPRANSEHRLPWMAAEYGLPPAAGLMTAAATVSHPVLPRSGGRLPAQDRPHVCPPCAQAARVNVATAEEAKAQKRKISPAPDTLIDQCDQPVGEKPVENPSSRHAGDEHADNHGALALGWTLTRRLASRARPHARYPPHAIATSFGVVLLHASRTDRKSGRSDVPHRASGPTGVSLSDACG
jgi:hypothetical protein